MWLQVQEGYKIDEYFGIKNCSWEKCPIGELILAFEDEILNTTKTSVCDKKVACEKNNCLIYIISLITICL